MPNCSPTVSSPRSQEACHTCPETVAGTAYSTSTITNCFSFFPLHSLFFRPAVEGRKQAKQDSRIMKNGSATHILGLLLVAATSSSARKYHGADEFGGSSVHEVRHPAGAHGGAGVPDHAREHRPSPRAHGVVMEDSMYSHAMLHEHVHHGQAPVGLDVGLMHPLPHYLIGFMKWTYEFGVSFGNVDEATHALKVIWQENPSLARWGLSGNEVACRDDFRLFFNAHHSRSTYSRSHCQARLGWLNACQMFFAIVPVPNY